MMKRKFNVKLISLVLSVAIVLSLSISISVTAVYSKASGAVISAATVEAERGETVQIPITVSENLGIVSATLTVTYDSENLTLTNVADKGLLGETAHKPELKSPYTLVWVNDTVKTDFTSDGVIVVLTFDVAREAEVKNYPITLSYDYDNYDIYNKDLKPVKFTLENGSVRLDGAPDETEPDTSASASSEPDEQITTAPASTEPRDNPTAPSVTDPQSKPTVPVTPSKVKPAVKKAANTMKVKVSKKTVSLKKLKKKAQKIKALKVTKAKGKVSFKILKRGTAKKIRKLVKISKKGVITIKKWKKAKKGTYNFKVNITAAGNANYKSGSKTVTVKIKVK